LPRSIKAREAAKASSASPEGEAPADPETDAAADFDIPVRAAQRSWLAGRDARYEALFNIAPLLRRAIELPKSWAIYCKRNEVKGRTVEAQVFDVALATDAEAQPKAVGEISRDRRATYAGVIGYFAFMCTDMGADEAIQTMKDSGGMEGAAHLYRNAHEPHFTTGGRKSRGTGKRPGRPAGSGRKKADQKDPVIAARLWGLDKSDHLTAFMPAGDPMARRVVLFAFQAPDGDGELQLVVGPFDTNEADRVLAAINGKPLSEVKAFLAHEDLQPETTDEFGFDNEGEDEDAEGEDEDADAEAELDRLRQGCRDAFETFMASDPDEGELHDLRDYLLGLGGLEATA
jgi:hypothetical protein